MYIRYEMFNVEIRGLGNQRKTRNQRSRKPPAFEGSGGVLTNMGGRNPTR